MIILHGGNGFIGRHVAVAAENRVPVSIVSRSFDPNFLAEWAPSARPVSLDDFCSPLGEALIRSARAFVVLSHGSPERSELRDLWDGLSLNLSALNQLLIRVAEINPRIRIIFPSSGGTVYGEGHTRPIPETAPLAPICGYGLSKVIGETALAFLARRTGIEYAILRISNPVGRWHRSNTQGLIEIVMQKASAGEPVQIFGDGASIRDYFDADDMADAILSVAEAEGPLRGVWNIGSGIGTTVVEAINEVSRRCELPLTIEHVPPRPWDVSYAVLDVSKAKADFGWTTRSRLREVIAKLKPHFL